MPGRLAGYGAVDSWAKSGSAASRAKKNTEQNGFDFMRGDSPNTLLNVLMRGAEAVELRSTGQPIGGCLLHESGALASSRGC